MKERSKSEFKLPDKPSELIRLALKDLELVEKDDHYVVDMDTWHEYIRFKSKCSVCLAGSVMAKSLDASPYLSLNMRHFSQVGKLMALDNFRLGYISAGAALLGVDTSHPDDRQIVVSVTPYFYNPREFKKDMRKIASIFEGIGL